jgi:hypothetical protein
MSGDEILVNMMKAALMDACVEKKLTQFKTAIFLNGGPRFARIIVVPEEMDRKWPVDAPLGSVSTQEGA